MKQPKGEGYTQLGFWNYNTPWNLERFHEPDAGREACGSEALCSSGICGSHWNQQTNESIFRERKTTMRNTTVSD